MSELPLSNTCRDSYISSKAKKLRLCPICIAILFSFLFPACSQQYIGPPESTQAETKPTNPQKLDGAPDLSAYRTLEVTSNSTSKREVGEVRFVMDGAYFEAYLPGATSVHRMFIQVEDCRNSTDPICQRRFVISGDLSAFSSRLKCYIQIRNDSNSGYFGQALQGLCQDTNSRSFAITLSR
jgi:hypothetical protein